tara:strand:- start:44 stop:235 length:192 start_codon:yes stop_codon:yes gene_type:complete
MKCNICDSDIDIESGDVVGFFGICEVSFCVWCMSSMTDMVIQLNGFDNVEILKERIKEIEYDM